MKTKKRDGHSVRATRPQPADQRRKPKPRHQEGVPSQHVAGERQPHTPGPWFVRKDHLNHYEIVTIGHCCFDAFEVCAPLRGYDHDSIEQHAGNAELIARAPELLNAARDALRLFWRWGYADKTPEVAELERLVYRCGLIVPADEPPLESEPTAQDDNVRGSGVSGNTQAGLAEGNTSSEAGGVPVGRK